MEYKFSVITVVLNAEKTIEKTIQSVIDQTYTNVEYIIIDGGSNDGTREIIKKYEQKISFWSSEKDKGIYDAMNKGLLKSTGEIILILNADDHLINNDILSDVNNYFIHNKDIKLIYGRIHWQFFNPDYTVEYLGHLSLEGLKRGKMIFQASTFMKREVFDIIGFFNTRYYISGDFDLFCRFINANLPFNAYDKTIAYFRSDGKSANHNVAWKEGTEIIRKYYGNYYATRFALIKSFELNTKKLLIRLKLFDVLKKIRKKLIFA